MNPYVKKVGDAVNEVAKFVNKNVSDKLVTGKKKPDSVKTNQKKYQKRKKAIVDKAVKAAE